MARSHSQLFESNLKSDLFELFYSLEYDSCVLLHNHLVL